jgi:hypothetical protein
VLAVEPRVVKPVANNAKRAPEGVCSDHRDTRCCDLVNSTPQNATAFVIDMNDRDSWRRGSQQGVRVLRPRPHFCCGAREHFKTAFCSACENLLNDFQNYCARHARRASHLRVQESRRQKSVSDVMPEPRAFLWAHLPDLVRCRIRNGPTNRRKERVAEGSGWERFNLLHNCRSHSHAPQRYATSKVPSDRGSKDARAVELCVAVATEGHREFEFRAEMRRPMKNISKKKLSNSIIHGLRQHAFKELEPRL